jgi:N-acetyl-anhydromuramyl-L-alanine amidase AmpD
LADPKLGALDIHRWHVQRGWLGIGYHYVIRTDGEIEEGRPEQWRGAHAEQVNSHSIGICLIGGCDAEQKPQANFTVDQLRALRMLLNDVLDRHPLATILGHRDIPGVAKACPSFNVKRWLTTGEVKA